MDKNIVAFLRDDVTTIGVRFFSDNQRYDPNTKKMTILGEEHWAECSAIDGSILGSKEYTYVTQIPDIKVGDYVVVIVSEIPKVVKVTRVDTELNIAPNDPTIYKWVVDKVDVESYVAEKKKNKELRDLLAVSYRTNMRQQFRNAILGGMDDNSVKRITNILEGKKDE